MRTFCEFSNDIKILWFSGRELTDRIVLKLWFKFIKKKDGDLPGRKSKSKKLKSINNNNIPIDDLQVGSKADSVRQNWEQKTNLYNHIERKGVGQGR